MSFQGTPEEVRFEDFAFETVKEFYMPMHAGEIIDASGAFAVMSFAAGGKGTICGILKDAAVCEPTISHTTREPELRDGLDPLYPETSTPRPDTYNFVDEQHMVGKILAGEMLEVAMVHGNIYGTSLDGLEAIASKGKRPVLDIDVQGVKNILDVAPNFPNFFLVPENLRTLIKRWAGRDAGNISAEQFMRRLNTTRSEALAAIDMAYGDTTKLIVNDNALRAAGEIRRVLGEGKAKNTREEMLILANIIEELEDSTNDDIWERFQRAA